MGHHFVPQAYLRAFEDPSQPGSTWTHVRVTGKSDLVPISVVAQSRSYYDPDTETDLATLVEGPANPLLTKLRGGALLDEAERMPFAIYVATMMKRVPKSRQRGERLVGPALEQTVANIHDEINELAGRGLLESVAVSRLLADLDKAYSKFAETLPDAVAAQIRNPRPTSEMVRAVLAMAWRWVRAPAGEFFTSDNPAFFHEAYGIGTPKSELRFPISPTVAFHGTMAPRQPAEPDWHLAPREWVREFNRSQAAGATSVAFAHRRSTWLHKLLQRQEPYLFQLRWTP